MSAEQPKKFESEVNIFLGGQLIVEQFFDLSSHSLKQIKVYFKQCCVKSFSEQSYSIKVVHLWMS